MCATSPCLLSPKANTPARATRATSPATSLRLMLRTLSGTGGPYAAPMLTRAAVLWETGAPLSVEEVELADPRAGEVRVRIAAAGVCRSDLHVMEGVWTYDLPMVLGHEGAGIVEAVGPGVLAPRVGDAVALAWVTACGRCRACASGSPALCEIGSHLHRMPEIL